MIAAPWSGTCWTPSVIGRKTLVIAGPRSTFFKTQYTARPGAEPDSIVTLPCGSTETRSWLPALPRPDVRSVSPMGFAGGASPLTSEIASFSAGGESSRPLLTRSHPNLGGCRGEPVGQGLVAPGDRRRDGD